MKTTERRQQSNLPTPPIYFSPPHGNPQFHPRPNKAVSHQRQSAVASSKFHQSGVGVTLGDNRGQLADGATMDQLRRTPAQINNPSSNFYSGIQNRLSGSPVEVVYPPVKPESTNRIEYVYYDTYQTDYEEQQVLTTVQVPVQKRMLNHYAVEHIVEYVPQEIDEFKVEMVPEEIIYKRLHYVPVEEQIIHLPKNRHAYLQAGNSAYPRPGPQMHHTFVNQQRSDAHSAVPNSTHWRSRIPKTNFVTSDGYVPLIDEAHERRIQQIIVSAENVPVEPMAQNNRANFQRRASKSSENREVENSRQY